MNYNHPTSPTKALYIMQTKQLSSLVRYHRKKARLSQTALAEHAGVSRTTIQDLEAGKGRTTWKNLLAVLTTLNLTLEPNGPLVDQWQASLTDRES
jgi:y4mF family transcriptional regulator